MVLRMMMRWAESRGFKVELLRPARGRRPGIKSATFRAAGENAYGLFNAEKGVHRLVRISPFDAADPPPDGVRRRRGRAGRSRTPATSRSTPTTCRSTPTAPPAPAASTSTRPTRPCASPTVRPASSCSARTSARSRPTRTTAMKMLRAKLLELRGARAPGGDRQGAGRDAGRQLRLADPLLRPAPVHDGQGPPHRPRDGRRPARARRRPRRLRARLPAHRRG